MPKAGRPPKNDLPQSTFVLDNGGDTIKAGFAPAAGANDEEALQSCQVIPNILVRTRDRRTYVAAHTERISQWNDAVFRRPVEHGQLVNWQSEQEIWEHAIFDGKTASKNTFIERPADTTFILTEAPNTLPALQKNTDEIVMEEWAFGGYSRISGKYAKDHL
jgi:actin-related protein 6